MHQRIFSQFNQEIAGPEWFFRTREGVVGPYESREFAHAVLVAYIDLCISLDWNGGRKKCDVAMTNEQSDH